MFLHLDVVVRGVESAEVTQEASAEVIYAEIADYLEALVKNIV